MLMFVRTKLVHSDTKYGTCHFIRMMPVTLKGPTAFEANTE